MIIADIGPKFYPQHHQSILAGLNAVNFHKSPVDLQWKRFFQNTYLILDQTVPDESLYWQEPDNCLFDSICLF
jgi:hypothetical protein